MSKQFILSAYLEEAIARATYDKLEDNTYSGRIPECKGVIAFGNTLNECAAELRSTLEEWVVLGLKMGHPLPVIAGIDLNKEPEIEPARYSKCKNFVMFESLSHGLESMETV